MSNRSGAKTPLADVEQKWMRNKRTGKFLITLNVGGVVGIENYKLHRQPNEEYLEVMNGK